MKKLLSVILLGVALLTFALPRPALAGDVAAGASVFSANCAACHMGGRNVIVANKTLSKSDLAKYLKGFDDDAVAAVAYQVTNGKNAMPGFNGRLSPKQIEDVAAYVVDQAEKGW
ncbi:MULTISPECIES: cytochrome c6 PetJ [Arthrospira]|nr:c-type cytochrome [Arthrospira platensis]KDR55240.1 cytochrome C6 [Arthrospira platensis str. Paraca]MBD2667682.1 c-type cytochrome [Arthrospira platensis FACHB-439]MBD2709000.1 c-type cytochrome [Arthrospira platensis FACHB-835]MDF2208183.1 c-type cytochrome [Arthrospira platensis NCB002]MDT9182724.1 c-type cytochrome [Limnospira sp. PMC 289.06]MDT9295515.1 c-type cytochrome [Arthrospira platensis PCC 7345]MDT9311324.1 c-type cytochrome [Limnospira sp. Paracas R14]QQW28760.1 c-type cyto